MKKIVFLFAAFACGIFLPQKSAAQQVLTLKGALKIAEQNNLTLLQSRNAEEVARLNSIQAKASFFPSASIMLSGNHFLGQAVDQFSLSVNENPWNGNFSGTASMPLFNGFTRWHNLRGAEHSLDAAHEATNALLNDILSQVTLIYFQVLFDRDNLQISNNKMALLEKQVERVQAQEAAGTRTKGDYYNVRSQLATEKVTNVNLKNQMEKDLLTLVQLLDLDPSKNYELEIPSGKFEVSAEGIPTVDSVYAAALADFPDIREKEFRLLAAEENIGVARASMMPSVSLSFSSGSNYSSGRRDFLMDSLGNFVPGERIPFNDQISQYWTNGFSMGISIPIFQNFRNRINYQQAQVTYDNAQINLDLAKNQLIKEIQQAYLDVNAAREKYQASVENLEFLTESFNYMQTKYDEGLIDFYSFSEILNNKTSAENSVNQARYDFLLKKKILDLYMGKEISF